MKKNVDGETERRNFLNVKLWELSNEYNYNKITVERDSVTDFRSLFGLKKKTKFFDDFYKKSFETFLVSSLRTHIECSDKKG